MIDPKIEFYNFAYSDSIDISFLHGSHSYTLGLGVTAVFCSHHDHATQEYVSHSFGDCFGVYYD